MDMAVRSELIAFLRYIDLAFFLLFIWLHRNYLRHIEGGIDV